MLSVLWTLESSFALLFSSIIIVETTKLIKAPVLLAEVAKQSLVSLSESQADELYEQGTEHFRQRDYQSAISSYQQSLSIYRQINEALAIKRVLYALGLAHYRSTQYHLAIEYYQEALALGQRTRNFNLEALIWIDLGLAYDRIGEYFQALESYGQSIDLFQEIDDSFNRGRVLFNTGVTYSNLSNYSEALNNYQQALTAFIEAESMDGQGNALGNIGLVYSLIGDFTQALNYYQQALTIFEQTENLFEQRRILQNIGFTYYQKRDFLEALDFYENALSISELSRDVNAQGRVLESIGEVYVAQGDYLKAIVVLERAFKVAKDVSDRRFEGRILNHLGSAYRLQREYVQAFESYRKSLIISREINDRAGEAFTLRNVGKLFSEQQRTELAIIFYKQSVNVTESIRQDIASFPSEQRELYTALVTNRYRELADLLLLQGRILEAQQVLELLKVEELREFTRATYTIDGIAYDPIEQDVVDAYGNLMTLGAEIYRCDPNCDQDLYDQQIALERFYDKQVREFQETVELNRAEDDVFYDPGSLASDALDIVNSQTGTVLIYPVVLEDSLWLLWTATGGVVGSVEVTIVDRADLSRAVQRFRDLIGQRDDESYATFKVTSQKLYSWLIAPLETELEKNNIHIRHLVFAQDRVTRYIPMAALHDGKQFLIERYIVSTVLSAALTDTTDRLGEVETSQALALGLSQALPGYSALPNVDEELDALVKSSDDDPIGIYPGTVMLNEQFTFEALSHNVRRHNILHIATHAEFVPGPKEASFMLLGNGERFNIVDIDALETQFNRLHLVVLSACQTALGGEALDGTEIAGVSSYFLGKNKAESVLATLWKVDDAGTSILMQRFYQLLATGQLTKAEALQQAQLSLLYKKKHLAEQLTPSTSRGSLVPVNVAEAGDNGLSHPYYWAPFILIGNSF